MRVRLFFLVMSACAAAAAGAPLTVTSVSDSGPGSLRQAILDAESASGHDTISFAIPGSGVHTIAVQTPLPLLTDPAGVTIDGYTQPGASANTLPVGNNAVLKIEIEGSNLTQFTSGALVLLSSGNTIRGLVINRFAPSGLFVGGTGNTVQGNFIGTDPAGTTARPNARGVQIQGSGHLFGGSVPGARNVVSGNDVGGVGLAAESTVVRGNYIGTNASGSAALANGAFGLGVEGSFNSIGGQSPTERNVISGNNPGGPPYRGGIAVSGGENNVLQGNIVGADATGVVPIPNIGAGIVLESATNGTTVGGSTAAAGNRIAFNTGVGILVGGGNEDFAHRNRIASNSIFENGGLGIDLGGNGPTPNDPLDADPGPNKYQNFPSLLFTHSGGGSTIVQGKLQSTPGSTFTVQLFASSSCDASGHGEGEEFIGSTSVGTNDQGEATFSVALPAIAQERRVTATATDALGNTSEFSECSPLATRFYTLAPCRVVDTRDAPGPGGGPTLSAHSFRDFPVAGHCGIPMTARSVAFNFTVTQASYSGHLTIYPTGSVFPLASTLNFGVNQTRANNAIIPVGPAGEVTVYTGQAAGSTHFIADVFGYFE